MILELDLGNTRIKWRLRIDSGKVARTGVVPNGTWDALTSALNYELSYEWDKERDREPSDELRHESRHELGSEPSNKPAAELGLQSSSNNVKDTSQIRRVLVASVLNDQQKTMLQQWCINYCAVPPEFAQSQATSAGVSNGYDVPGRLGVDRWLAMLSAYEQVRQACVVVDCGSAITLDLIDDGGQHLGGYIAPGLKMMRRALTTSTQGVAVQEAPNLVTLTPGRTTESAVAAAQSAMLVGLVTQAITYLQSGCAIEPILFFTGGDAKLLLSYFPGARYQPDLVLDGLVLAFER